MILRLRFYVIAAVICFCSFATSVQASGGVTGGCTVGYNVVGPGNAYTAWGTGCTYVSGTFTAVPTCASAAVTGYSCGQIAVAPDGLVAYCKCVKN